MGYYDIFCYFLTLKSVIYGHYILLTDFGRSYHKCCWKTTEEAEADLFLISATHWNKKNREACSLIF